MEKVIYLIWKDLSKSKVKLVSKEDIKDKVKELKLEYWEVENANSDRSQTVVKEDDF